MIHLSRVLANTMSLSADDLSKIATGIAVLIGLCLLIAGASDKVVIFYDVGDLMATFFSVLLPIAGMILWRADPFFDSSILNNATKYFVSPGMAALGLILFIKAFTRSIKHNRSILLGILVGVYKFAFLLFGILAVFGYFAKVTDRRSTVQEVLILSVLFSIFGVIAQVMINGERVDAERQLLEEGATDI